MLQKLPMVNPRHAAWCPTHFFKMIASQEITKGEGDTGNGCRMPHEFPSVPAVSMNPPPGESLRHALDRSPEPFIFPCALADSRPREAIEMVNFGNFHFMRKIAAASAARPNVFFVFFCCICVVFEPKLAKNRAFHFRGGGMTP
jgi:hypothetical protein